MKVTYGNEPKKEEPKYPYFGEFVRDNGSYVVMFTKESTGIVVKSEDKYNPLFLFSDDWIEDIFNKLDNFSVTLSVP